MSNDEIRMSNEVRNPNIVRAGHFGDLIHKYERGRIYESDRLARSFPGILFLSQQPQLYL